MALTKTSEKKPSPPLDVDEVAALHDEKGSIVAIDDDPMTLRLLQGLLKGSDYRIRVSTDASSGLKLIDASTSVVLVDLQMPEVSGFDCLRHIRKNHPQVQVIVVTGSSQTSDAVEAMKAGAFQYVTKPFDPKQLRVYVDKAMQASKTEHENLELRESHSHNLPVEVPQIVGDVNDWLMTRIDSLAKLDSTVFIGGESGTGKSTIARMIHQKSNRANKPFVSINCASLPRDLLTSELFGHTKGAFTGAVSDRAGHAEVANGGTLFLDEIGDLPLELQPKLLTFLQDRTIQRLGSSEVRKVDVRLIVATHRDLAEMCREQAFRQDLFFRLMVLSLELPPLRHRLSELPMMAEAALTRICKRMGMPPKRLTANGLGVLLKHSWPGNIRELENVLERAAAFSPGLDIGPDELVFTNMSLNRPSKPRDTDMPTMPPARSFGMPQAENFINPAGNPFNREQVRHEEHAPVFVNHTPQLTSIPAPKPQIEPVFTLAGKSLDAIEREAIQQTLAVCNGNKAKSARMLGISEKSIYNKMRRLNVEWPPSPGMHEA